MRAGTLQAHASQLESIVTPGRGGQADVTTYNTGVRTVVGPETRSLLRQLRDSRDVKVQRHLVREVVAQIRKRVNASERRSAMMRRARARAVRAARATARAVPRVARAVPRVARGLWGWLASAVTGTRNIAGGRGRTRVVGNRTTTRTRHGTTTRTRVVGGRATRSKKPARPRAARWGRT
jgi:hypothetical protein